MSYIGRPPECEYLAELVNVGGAGEERHADEQLTQDAPRRPDVHHRPVVTTAEQHLRRSVVSGNNTRCVLSIRCSKNLRETEICKFNCSILTDQQIARCQILKTIII